MIKRLNNSKGITLIALVITIIVLLILAGVAISMLSGDNGIIRQAQKAKEQTEEQSKAEAMKLGATSALTTGYGHIKTTNDLQTGLEQNGVKLDEDVTGDKDDGYTVKTEGEKYLVLSNGEILKIETDVTKLTTVVQEKIVYEHTNADETETYRAVIPAGFKISSESTEQDINSGLVVKTEDENEFVWVPVPDVIYDGTTEIVVGTYTPMARTQTGSSNYQGVLYDLNKAVGSQVVYDLTTYSVGTTKNREPSLVTGNSAETYAIIENVTGTSYDNGTDSTTGKKYYELAGYNSITEFGKDMQDEYNNMVISVNKYKGFYVGRYETSIDNTSKVAVSKNASTNTGVTTADAKGSTTPETKYWYGLYNKQRTMAKDNNLTSVESSMIWGSQYDAMMNWMINTGNVVGTGYDTTKRISGIKVTGQSENDIINKVHDLYGCHYEWTLQASITNVRVSRGGNYDYNYSPSYRNSNSPSNATGYCSSRLTLYVR